MWDLKRIDDLILNGIEENLNLDYKSAEALAKTDGKKSEISKDVSAFANSAGGVIIYGISEYNDPTKKHLPETIDAVDRNVISKEWLEQVINTNISPKIEGIKIHPVVIGDIKDNKVVYVVDIPQSKTAHQAKDKRYYKRYNFESIPMEDYEIRDIFNRANKSDIRISFKNYHGKEWFKKYADTEGTKITADIWARNAGTSIVRNLQVFISGDKDASNFVINSDVEKGKYFQLLFSNEHEKKIKIGNDEFVINIDRIPILPNTERKIGEIVFYSNLIKEEIEIEILICTEDSNRLYNVKGYEIIDGKDF